MKKIDFSDAVKLSQDWLRGNVVFNLMFSGYRVESASTPNKKRDYFLIVCSLTQDINQERTHYVFLINGDGSFKKIGKGSYDEKTNTCSLKEIKLDWEAQTKA